MCRKVELWNEKCYRNLGAVEAKMVWEAHHSIPEVSTPLASYVVRDYEENE